MRIRSASWGRGVRQPPPTFTYQWLRDGASIASATGGTYTVEIADKSHVLSCNVAATNSEGRAEASSSNSVEVVRGTLGEGGLESTLPSGVIPALSAAEVLAVLRAQVARVQHHARISSLRRRGLYAFSVAAPAAGTLELVWYQAPQGARHSQRTKPLVVALSTTAYASAGTKPVSLRLTSAGRRLIGDVGAADLMVAVAWAKELQRRGTIEEFSIGPATLKDVYVRRVGPEPEREDTGASVAG